MITDWFEIKADRCLKEGLISWIKFKKNPPKIWMDKFCAENNIRNHISWMRYVKAQQLATGFRETKKLVVHES